MKFLAAIIFQTALLHFINGYPNGAPTSACSSLTPSHRNNRPQTSNPPFRVTATKRGEKVIVTISSRSPDFQGFILQARYAKTPNRLAEGKFTQQQGLSQTIDCQRGKQNTLTQTSNDPKSQITTEWTPEPGTNDQVIFRATVAKTFQEFWLNIDSPSVSVSSPGSRAQRQSGSKSSMYENCFVNKGCFGYPENCVNRKDCEVFLSYVDANNGVQFTMIGALGSSNNYMAMALSRDNRMGDDSVTECFMENGRVMVQTSWNRGKQNNPMTLVPEGMYESQFENGLTKCTWTRPYVTRFFEGTVDRKTFNLTSTAYYVLIAKGPMLSGRVGYHDVKLPSQDPVNFTAYEKIEAGGGAHDAVKVHGESHDEDTHKTLYHASTMVGELETETDSESVPSLTCKILVDWILLIALASMSGIWRML